MMYNRPKRTNKINATKIEQDGIKFDSRLELYLYNLLKEEDIEFEFQKEYVLQEGFKYCSESILPIKIRVDFVLPKYKFILDSKGFQMSDGKLKYKMLKFMLFCLDTEYRIEMPSSQKRCREVVESIKRGYFTVDEPISESVAKSRRKALTDSGFNWINYNWIKGEVTYDSHWIMSLQKYDFEQLVKRIS